MEGSRIDLNWKQRKSQLLFALFSLLAKCVSGSEEVENAVTTAAETLLHFDSTGLLLGGQDLSGPEFHLLRGDLEASDLELLEQVNLIDEEEETTANDALLQAEIELETTTEGEIIETTTTHDTTSTPEENEITTHVKSVIDEEGETTTTTIAPTESETTDETATETVTEPTLELSGNSFDYEDADAREGKQIVVEEVFEHSSGERLHSVFEVAKNFPVK